MQGNKFYFDNDSLVTVDFNKYKRIGDVRVGDRIWIDYNTTGIVAKIERMVRHDMVQVNTTIMHAICSQNCEVFTLNGFQRFDRFNGFEKYANLFIYGVFLPSRGVQKFEGNVHCTYLLIACDNVYRDSIVVNNFKFRSNCFDATIEKFEIKQKKAPKKLKRNSSTSSISLI